MRIAVLVKQILDPSGITVRRDKERLFVNREEYIIDPASKAALEAALQVKDASGGQVSALCMGPPRADDALREALAMGCDAAYLLCDEAFEPADASVAAHILKAALDRMGGADLVVAGQESTDTGSGQIAPRLAEALDYAQVTAACSLQVSGSKLVAVRQWSASYARVQVSLPAVVAVAPSAFRPRYAPGARIMNAYREWEVTVWDAGALGLDPSDLKPVLIERAQSFPPPLEVGEIFQGEPGTVAEDVIATLRQQRLVG
jgi:electron transfer flavoprotein beta subunit